MKILCVLNPIAGGGRTAKRVTAAIHKTFEEAHVAYDIVITQKKADGKEFSKNAEKAGYTHVVAIGGDGTVNEVATGLVGTSTILGIIPVGSGNGLARALRIPLHYQDACQLILQGKSRKIDVGQVCGRFFFATSGIGFDAHIGKLFNEKAGHPRGFLTYVQFAVTEYFNYTPQEIVLHCNGKSFRYTPFVLTVANGEQYGGGAIIAPNAIPDDGLFDVSIILQTSLFRILPHLPKIFLGTIDSYADFITHKTNSLTITRSAPGPVHVDGESFMAGEVLEYTLLPHALNVQLYEKAFEIEKLQKQAKTSSGNLFATLEKLAQLKEKGIINEEEFKTQKRKFMERL